MKLQNKGFTLVEVLVASSVLLIAGLALGSLIVNQARQVSYLEDRMSYQNLKEEINQLLNDPVACKNSLETVKVPNVLGNVTKGALTLKSQSNQLLFDPSNPKKNSYDRITISKISLKNDNVGMGDVNGEGVLQIEVKRQRTGLGPDEFAIIEKPVYLEVNPARAIQSCSGTDPNLIPTATPCLKSYSSLSAASGSAAIPSTAKQITVTLPGNMDSSASSSGVENCTASPYSVDIPLDGSLHPKFVPGGVVKIVPGNKHKMEPPQLYYNGVHVATGRVCQCLAGLPCHQNNPETKYSKTGVSVCSTPGSSSAPTGEYGVRLFK